MPTLYAYVQNELVVIFRYSNMEWVNNFVGCNPYDNL